MKKLRLPAWITAGCILLGLNFSGHAGSEQHGDVNCSAADRSGRYEKTAATPTSESQRKRHRRGGRR